MGVCGTTVTVRTGIRNALKTSNDGTRLKHVDHFTPELTLTETLQLLHSHKSPKHTKQRAVMSLKSRLLFSFLPLTADVRTFHPHQTFLEKKDMKRFGILSQKVPPFV